jgi:hypothetical protein
VLDWSIDRAAPINIGGNTSGNVPCEWDDDNFLHQFTEGPTHEAGNKLDLLAWSCTLALYRTLGVRQLLSNWHCSFVLQWHVLLSVLSGIGLIIPLLWDLIILLANTTADFDRVFVEYFVQSMMLWEVFSTKDRNRCPTLVLTLLLNGGLYQMVLLFYSLFCSSC